MRAKIRYFFKPTEGPEYVWIRFKLGKLEDLNAAGELWNDQVSIS